MPRIIARIVDNGQSNAITIFADGIITIETEKAYVEFGEDGQILQNCWKEEPAGAHYQAISHRVTQQPTEIHVPARTDDNYPSAFESLCFALTRRPELIAETCHGSSDSVRN